MARKPRTNEQKSALPGAHRGPGTFYMNPWAVVLVGLDATGKYGPEQGRNHVLWNEDVIAPTRADLKANILAGKLHNPIKVTREGDHVLCLEGRDRVKALRELWDEAHAAGVPEAERLYAWVLPSKGKPSALAAEKVDCNMQRKIDNPLTVAGWAYQLLANGMSVEEVSPRVKLNAREVPLIVRVLDACQEVRDAVARGELPWRQAARLSSKTVAEQRRALREILNPPEPKGPPPPKVQPRAKLQAALVAAEQWSNGGAHKVHLETLLKWTLGYIDDAELAKQLPHLASAALEPAQATA